MHQSEASQIVKIEQQPMKSGAIGIPQETDNCNFNKPGNIFLKSYYPNINLF